MDRAGLRDWIREKHAGQSIRHSWMPYFDHLLAVAEMAAPFAELGYEAGLCHDLIEKTAVTPEQLLEGLIQFGYLIIDAYEIVGQVRELTNVYTKANFPHLKKVERKVKEAERLVGISPGAQTVKYADLLDNLEWVLAYDRPNLLTYLHSKTELLRLMNKGDPVLFEKAWIAFNGNY